MKNTNHFRTGRTCVFMMHVHLVFVTKYRVKALWGNHLWSPSYFAGFCGGAPLNIIKQYIDQQQKLLEG